MKKLYLIILLMISISTINAQIDSVWIGNSPEPCALSQVDIDTCYRTSGWVGPKTDTVWGNSADPLCNPDCYFVIVYYDRFDTLNTECYYLYGKQDYQDDEVQYYYPFISGIYWYGDDDCYECDTDGIESKFLEQFYTDAEDEMPGIINNLSVCYVGGQRIHCEGIATQYYTIGKCYDNDGKECDKATQRCCTNRVNINSSAADTLNREVDSVTYFPLLSDPLPPCPGSCEDGCDPKKKSLLAGLSTCAIPCNEGLWVSDSSETITIDSLLTGCSGCTIKIYFSYRNNNNPSCPDNYKDARFDSISYNCPTSCILQLTPEEMVSYVNDWLLKYSLVNNVPLGQCRDNYRLVNALCVTDYDTLTHTGLGNCNPIHNDQLGCCWGRYLVCKIDDSTYTAVKIDGSEMIGDTCVWFTRPCIPICDNVYNSIMSDPNDPFGVNTFEDVYRSMEVVDKAESYVVSSVNDGVNVYDKIGRESEVLIYDLFGKLVGNENTLPILYQHLVKGTYFITVKEGNQVLRIYKIYVEK
ncbi:MAG: hypothetical protein KDC55_00960 [Ignavibacteriae bacterium]|nr:hypothetical protein [Ignavibacteriota bacterium]MCB9221097.1 hypothetical protein [Ignavibacteria bacterium]